MGVQEITEEELAGPRAGNVREISEDDLAPPVPDPINPAPAPGRASEIGFFNRGIASVLGMPADLSNEIAKLVGIVGPNERVFGGRESIETMFRAGGELIGEDPRHMAPLPSERAETAGEFIAQGAGTGAVPVGAAGTLVKGTGAVARALGDVGATAVTRPLTITALELLSGVGAGAGEFAGVQIDPDSDLARVIGAIAGGFGLPVAASVATLPSRTVAKGVKKAVVPFTKAGAKPRAERRIRDLAGGEEGAAAASRELTAGDVLSGANLTPAQRTGNRRLLALERAVLEADNKLSDKFSKRFSDSSKAIRSEIRGLGQEGSAAATRTFLANRRDYVLSLVGERLKRATAKAESRLNRLSPTQQRDAVNRVVREEVENALRSARAQENQIWGAIPQEVKVGTSDLRQTYIDIMLARGKASDPEDIPQFVKALMGKVKVEQTEAGLVGTPTLKKGKIKPSETVNTLATFRSRILREIRAEKAKDAPNREKIANLEKLQESILSDLGALEGKVSGEVGEAVRTAIEFSRTLNDRFTRGPVGRLLGYERRGGASVAETLTLETTVGKGGPRGAVEMEALINAGAPEGQIEEFLRILFSQQATKDGRIVPAAARQFITRNADILRRFPQLREQMESARGAQRIADSLGDRLATLDKNLRNKQLSRTALYLESRIDDEIPAVLRSKNPAGNIRQLVRQVGKDPTGDALKGLKTGFVDYLVNQSATRNFDEAGEAILSGNRFAATLEKPAVRKVARELFTADERKRLTTIANTMKKLETASAGLPDVGGVVRDAPNTVIEYAGRVLGARVGARAGEGTSGASLLTAGFLSQRVKRLLGGLTNDKAAKLLADAVQDKELFQALLTPVDSIGAERKVFQRLNAWLIGLGDREATEDRELRVTTPRSPDFQRAGIE